MTAFFIVLQLKLIFNIKAMTIPSEFQILHEHIRSRKLRSTPQRDAVLAVFLATEGHVSVEELHKLVKRKHPAIGYTTVYRTMKLLADVGLCRSVDFGDGVERFEHDYGHEHHDHLICTVCGQYIEVHNKDMEELQNILARQQGFALTSHVLKIYGVCRKCRK